MAAATVFLAVSGYSFALLRRLTPLYMPVSCTETNKTFDPPAIGAEVTVLAEASINCHNPNPYSLHVIPQGFGNVVSWPENIDLGSFQTAPHTLPARGNGSSTTFVNMSMPLSVAMHLHAMGDSIVLLQVSVKAIITVDLLFPGMAYSQELSSSHVCGMMMRPTIPMIVGGVTCSYSRDDVLQHIPNITADKALSSFVVGADESLVESHERQTQGILWSVAVVSGALGLLCSFFVVRRMLKRRRKCEVAELMSQAVAGTADVESATSPKLVTFADDGDLKCSARTTPTLLAGRGMEDGASAKAEKGDTCSPESESTEMNSQPRASTTMTTQSGTHDSLQTVDETLPEAKIVQL
eukprot:TRINITY_DN25874_c0_g1_i1.p1 TRINITY_DN25874_c0_g1~~TRINITY_DN25874_c0_g1_i1.p1  ORF type:complete len:386 (-),score=47.01 TRINITY_DN25874_c0_g1_i1:130-1188(-)